MKRIDGSTDNLLARGIHGYQLANAAEIMRACQSWKPEDFERFKNKLFSLPPSGF